MMGLV